MLTEQDARDYLGIDYEDEATNRRISQMMEAADKYLTASIGEQYPKDDPRVRELSLLVIADFYDSTRLGPKERFQISRIIEDLSWQIRLEMRK